METLADLHLVPDRDLDLVALHRAAAVRGVGILGTGAALDPGWRVQLRAHLEPAGVGLLRLRSSLRDRAGRGLPARLHAEVRFVAQASVATVSGPGPVVHLLLLSDLDAAERLAGRLAPHGLLDRPLPSVSLTPAGLVERVMEVDPAALVLPAAVFAPRTGALWWHADLEAAYGAAAPGVVAVDAGRMAAPAACWGVSALDGLTVLSTSGARSPVELGLESTILGAIDGIGDLRDALELRAGLRGTTGRLPETVPGGVAARERAADLADRPSVEVPFSALPHLAVLPLEELLAQVLGDPEAEREVAAVLRGELGPDLYILRRASLDDLAAVGGEALAGAVRQVRAGELSVSAPADGQPARALISSASTALRAAPPLVLCGDDDPLAGLDPSQLRAVHTPAPALVTGLAGTGRTRVLVARLAHAVRSGLAPSAALAVARDPRRAALLDEELAPWGVRATTLEALASRILDGPTLADATARRRAARAATATRAQAEDLLAGLPADPTGRAEAYRQRLDGRGLLDPRDLLPEARRRLWGAASGLRAVAVDDAEGLATEAWLFLEALRVPLFATADPSRGPLPRLPRVALERCWRQAAPVVAGTSALVGLPAPAAPDGEPLEVVRCPDGRAELAAVRERLVRHLAAERGTVLLVAPTEPGAEALARALADLPVVRADAIRCEPGTVGLVVAEHASGREADVVLVAHADRYRDASRLYAVLTRGRRVALTYAADRDPSDLLGLLPPGSAVYTAPSLGTAPSRQLSLF